jgi:heme/copper-type cytochrome/quinol oxidase subunit 3
MLCHPAGALSLTRWIANSTPLSLVVLAASILIQSGCIVTISTVWMNAKDQRTVPGFLGGPGVLAIQCISA